MCCHAVMIHTDYIIHLYFLVHKVTWTHVEDSQFSPQIMLRILKTCVLVFCAVSVVWSVWVNGSFCGSLFVDWYRFYFWVLWSIFNFLIAIFLLLPLD
jgi:hypothetical protein